MLLLLLPLIALSLSLSLSGYLPPSTQSAQLSSSSAQGIFDQLSDAEIEHIFAQANLAQQQQQQHQHHHHDYQHY